jgi:uncharacterized protein YegP (UPF0339 family)
MKFETYLDGKQEWRWRLVADNGRTIADSGEGYRKYDDCLHGIALVKISTKTPIVNTQVVKRLADALRTTGQASLLGGYGKNTGASLLGRYTIAGGSK